MASRRRSVKRAKIVDDDKRVIVETSRGVQLECHPIITEIEAQEENIRSQYEWPEVPHRDISDTVPPDAGPKWPRTEEIDQQWVDDEWATDEDKEAWAEYLKAYELVDAEFSTKMNDSRLRLIALRGVTVLDAKPEKEWVKEHEWMGMDVPEDDLERLMHFFRTEVLGTTVDMFTITKGIYRAAGFDQEVLDELEQSFRSEVGRAGRTEPEADQEEPGEDEPT